MSWLKDISVLARKHICPGQKTYLSWLEDISVLARRHICPGQKTFLFRLEDIVQVLTTVAAFQWYLPDLRFLASVSKKKVLDLSLRPLGRVCTVHSTHFQFSSFPIQLISNSCRNPWHCFMAPFLLANFLATLHFVFYLQGGLRPPYRHGTKYMYRHDHFQFLALDLEMS